MSNEKSTLRKRIVNYLRRCPETTANLIAQALHVEKITPELQAMVKDGSLTVMKKGKMTVYSVPVYRIGDKEYSIRELSRHPLNHLGLSAESIRERLHKGMTPYEALTIERCSAWSLEDAICKRRKADKDVLP